jgi:uncharacterized protein (DUF342 family)
MSEGKDLRGSLFEEDEPIGETPYVEIDEDGMTAYIIVPMKPLPTDLKELLAERSISFGIDAELLSDLQKQLYDKLKLEPKYRIAKGRHAVHGQPGELILRTKEPEDIIVSSEDLTQVDYKTYKRKMLAMGEKDKPVAMIIQPTKGNDGMDVYGNPIPGYDGEGVDLRLGENVFIEGRKIISRIDGLIEYKKNSDGTVNFDVSEVYFVNGDVDYTTGNIDFPGSVIVRGVIKAGFEVHALKDVVADTIRGNVTTKGDVVAKQGIIGGTQKSIINSGGGVYCKFMQYAKVICKESLTVKKSIVSSEIYSEGSIIVEGSPGAIVGGSLFAVESIEAKIFGSESYVKTEVALYKSARDVLLLREVVARRFQISKDLTRIDDYLGANKKSVFTGFGSEKHDQIAKLIKKREQLRKELLEKNAELKSIQKMLTSPLEGTINVGRAIWPEVRVSIAGKFILLKNERGKGEYYYDKAEEAINFR